MNYFRSNIYSMKSSARQSPGNVSPQQSPREHLSPSSGLVKRYEKHIQFIERKLKDKNKQNEKLKHVIQIAKEQYEKKNREGQHLFFLYQELKKQNQKYKIEIKEIQNDYDRLKLEKKIDILKQQLIQQKKVQNVELKHGKHKKGKFSSANVDKKVMRDYQQRVNYPPKKGSGKKVTFEMIRQEEILNSIKFKSMNDSRRSSHQKSKRKQHQQPMNSQTLKIIDLRSESNELQKYQRKKSVDLSVVQKLTKQTNQKEQLRIQLTNVKEYLEQQNKSNTDMMQKLKKNQQLIAKMIEEKNNTDKNMLQVVEKLKNYEDQQKSQQLSFEKYLEKENFNPQQESPQKIEHKQSLEKNQYLDEIEEEF